MEFDGGLRVEVFGGCLELEGWFRIEVEGGVEGLRLEGVLGLRMLRLGIALGREALRGQGGITTCSNEVLRGVGVGIEGIE